MPINPSIPLSGVAGPGPLLPQDLEQKRLTLRNLARQEGLDGQQSRLNEQRIDSNDLAMQQQQDTIGRATRVRDIVARTGGNLDAKAIAEIRSIDPGAADAFEQRAHQQWKRNADRNDYLISALEPLAGEEDPAKFGAQYKVQRARLLASKLFGEDEIEPEMTREQLMGMLPPEAQQKLREMVPLPKYLAEATGIPAGTKMSAARLEGLMRAHAYQENADSLAEQRKNPKPSSTQLLTNEDGTMSAVQVMPDGKVKVTPVEGVKPQKKTERPASTQLMTDDDGNVTAVQVMSDGTVRSQPVSGVKGKTRLSDIGGEDANKKRLETLRQEEIRLEKEERTLGAKRAEIGASTTSGKIMRQGKEQDLTATDRARLDADYKAADKRWNELQTRKQQIADERAALKGTAPATAFATAPAKGGGPRVTVRLPNGKYMTGTKAQIDAFAKEAGLSLQ